MKTAKLNSMKRQFRKTVVASSVSLLLTSNLYANPNGLSVVAGNASAQAVGNLLEVTNTPGAILNWQQFNIGAHETTRFIQENAASHVVNRVIGGDPSQILGSLQSNGHVFLINPSGIVFGQGAQIDTAGLLASTLSISDENLLSNQWKFSAGQSGAGALVNEGALTSHSGGSIVLLAPQIENSGIIHADGEVLLAAGHEVTIVDLKHPTIGLQVKVGKDQQAINLGQIVGQNISVFASLLKNTGVVEARGAQLGQGGVIQFRGEQRVELGDTSVVNVSADQSGSINVTSQAGDVLVSGVVRADSSAGVGGEVVLTGHRVALLGGTEVSANGTEGGGEVYVGGGWQGQDPAIQNAQQTVIQEGVVLTANALERGDGGEVVVWADGIASVSSTIEAKGGSLSGNGGRVETSAKGRLVDVTPADTSALNGQAGEWLLDPSNIVVVSPTRLEAIQDAFAEDLQPGEVELFFFSDYSLAGAELGAVDTYITTTDLVAALNNNSLVRLNTFSQVEGNGIVADGNISILDDILISRSVANPATLLLEASGSVFIDGNIGFSNDVELGTSAGSNFVLNVYSQGDINLNGQLGLNATATASSFGVDLTFDVDRLVQFNNSIDFGVAGLIEQPFLLNPFDDLSIVNELGKATGVVFNPVSSGQSNVRNIGEIAVTTNGAINRELGLLQDKRLNISVIGSKLNLGVLNDGSFLNDSINPNRVSVKLSVRSDSDIGVINAGSLQISRLFADRGGQINLLGSSASGHFAGILDGFTDAVINVDQANFISEFVNFQQGFTLNLGSSSFPNSASGSAIFGAISSLGEINLKGGNSFLAVGEFNLNGVVNVGSFAGNESLLTVRDFNLGSDAVVNLNSGATLDLGTMLFSEFFPSQNVFGTFQAAQGSEINFMGWTGFVSDVQPVDLEIALVSDAVLSNQLVTKELSLVQEQVRFAPETTMDLSGLGGVLNAPVQLNVSGTGSQIVANRVIFDSIAPALTIGRDVVVNVTGSGLDVPLDSGIASLTVFSINTSLLETETLLRQPALDRVSFQGSLNVDGGRVLLGGSDIDLQDSVNISLNNADLALFGGFQTADLAAVNRTNSDLFIGGFWDNSTSRRGSASPRSLVNPLDQGSIIVADDVTISGGSLRSSVSGNAIVVGEGSLLTLEGVDAGNDFVLNPNGYMLVDTQSSLDGAEVLFQGDAGLILETDSTGVRDFNDRVTFKTAHQGNTILAGFRTSEPFETQVPPSTMTLNLGKRVKFEITGNAAPENPLPGLVNFYGSQIPERSAFQVGFVSEGLLAVAEFDETLPPPGFSAIGTELLINGVTDNQTILLGGDGNVEISCVPDFCIGFDPVQGGTFDAMVVSTLSGSDLKSIGIDLSGAMDLGNINRIGRVVSENGRVRLNLDGGDFLFDPTIFDGADDVFINANIRFPANVEIGFLPSVFVVNGQMVVETNLNLGQGFFLSSTGTLLNSGNLTLNGVDANAIQGSIFNSGTIVLGQGQSLNLFGNIEGSGLLRNQGQLNFTAGSNFGNTLNNAAGGSVNFSQGTYNFASDLINQGSANISGSLNFGPGGRLVQTQGGLVFRPNSQLIGNLDLVGGSAQVFGTVVGNVNVGSAIFQPGNSPGLTTIRGDLNLAPTSQTLIEFQGNDGVAGQDFDFIQVLGNANLNGVLSLVDISALGSPGRSPTINTNGNPLLISQLFRFLEATSINGQFSSVSRSVRTDANYVFSAISLVGDASTSLQALEVSTQSSAPVFEITSNPTNTGQEGDLERAYLGPEIAETTLQQPLPVPSPEEETRVNEEDEEAKRLAGQGSTTKPVSTQSEQLTVTSTRSNPIRPGDAECK